MGDHIRSKTKLGYIIDKHITAKIFSILLVMLLISTAFSSITVAQKPADSIRDKIGKIIDKIIGDGGGKTDDSSEGAVDDEPAFTTKLGGLFKELSMLKREKTPIFSVVTKYKDIETTTRLRRFLPTSIDVNDDGKKDIRVWVFRFPGIDLRPPAACIKTTLLVRRLSDDIKSGPFEIYLQYTPKIISKLAKTPLPSIRIGYQTPAGEEVPKYCIVTHKNIPHLLYPKLKTTHRIAINPGPAVGKSQLNLIFSIVNETSKSELTIQVNHSPAIKNEISFSLSKDHFIRRGETLEISRKNVVPSNVSLFIKDIKGIDSGSLTVNNLPKKITLSWLLARSGYIELSTHGASTGKVEAVVDGAISLGFKPETGVNFRFSWETPGLRNMLKKGKSFNLGFDASASATLSDLYVDVPNFNLLGFIKPQKLKLTASLLSFNLKAGVDAGKVILKPYAGADTVTMNVENADVRLENCNVDLKPAEVIPPPTISIVYPENGDTVKETITIRGIATASVGRTIKLVQVSIDDGDWINLSADVSGNWYYDWDTKALPNGKHTIYAQCFDSEGIKSKDPPADASVTANNPDNNWYPSVTIDSPSLFAVLFNDIVTISGTASDPDGNEHLVSVEVKINNGEWIKAQGTTEWSYQWNTASLQGGLYTISARSYDGIDYSPIESKTVFVRFSSIAEFNLVEASINVTNFEVKYNSLGNITDLAVSSFAASGSGSLKIAEGAISAEAIGSLEVQDFSVHMRNESGKTMLSLDNMTADVYGYGMVLLSPAEIALELNASIYLDVDGLYIADVPILGTLNLGECIIKGKGLISAGVKFDDGNISIGGYRDRDDVLLDVRELLIDISDVQKNYFKIGAKQIKMNGGGSISVGDKQITARGSLDEFKLDDFYIHTDLGVVYLSGDFEFTTTASLTLDVSDANSFNLSSNGEGSIKIKCPKVEIRPKDSGSVGASATSIEIYSSEDGYVSLSYYKDEFNVSCYVNIDNIVITDLFVWFNDSSLYIGNITGPFKFWFNLTGDIKIEMGDDWIKITIGGRYRYVKASSGFKFNDKTGLVNVEFELLKNEDVIVINISGIPDDVTVEVDGSVSVKKINKIYLFVQDIVEINVSEVFVSFGLHATAEKGNLILNLTDAERLLDMGYIYVNISNLFEATIEGSIASSHSGSGFLNITWDGTGLAGLDIEADGFVELNFTDFYLDVSSGSSFLLAEFAMFKITGDVELDYKEGFMDVSADLNGSGIKIITHLESKDLYLSLEIGSLLVERGGLFTWEDKNLSFTSYSDTKFGLYNFSLDFISEGGDMDIYLIIEESDIVFSGADLTIKIDFSGDNLTVAVDELTPYASITINTLWMLSPDLIEVRLHELVISVPMTVSFDGGQVTIDLDNGIITAGEISVINFVNFIGDIGLYGVEIQVSDDTSISLGIDDTGGIVVDFSAAAEAHFDNVIGPNSNIFNDIDFDFEGAGVFSINLNDWVLMDPVLHIEASVSENTTISLMATGIMKNLKPIFGLITEEIAENNYLVIKAEPGKILLNTDMEQNIIFASTSLVTLGLKDPLFPLLDFNFSIQFKGYMEALKSQIATPYNYSAFNLSDLKMAALFKISRYIIRSGEIIERYVILNGNGSGYLSWGTDENDKFHVAGYWDEGYLTLIKNVENIITGETEIVRLILHGVDFDIKLGTGEGIIKLLKWLIFGGLGIWYMNENGEWVKIWPLIGAPPIPPVKGIVTLFANKMETYPIEIIPGDDVSFTAFYVPAIFTNWINSNSYQSDQQPGQQQGQQVPKNGQSQQGGVGGLGEDKLTFELKYGDGQTQTFEVNYSDEPIKVDLGKHRYTSLGTFNAKLTVSGDPDAVTVAVDTQEMKSEAKYLEVSDDEFYWNYDKVSDDGKIHGSFEVKNKAHEIYSGGYVLEWEIENYTNIINNMTWGTEWVFTPNNGSLPSNSSQIVNFSFKPPVNKSDYVDANITIIDSNNASVNKKIKFNLEYGYIDILPDSTITLYMPDGGTAKTFENVFWIYTRYWERQGLPWEVNYTYSNAHTNFSFNCSPSNGVKHRGELPNVDLKVQPIKQGVYNGTIKVERTGDPADNDTIKIKLIVGKSNIPIDITLFDYEGDWINKSEYFRVHVEDGYTGDPIEANFIEVNYYKHVEDIGWELIYSTSVNSNGDTGLIQAQLDDGLDIQLSKIEVTTDNQSYEKGLHLFYVYPPEPGNVPPVAVLDSNVYYATLDEIISFNGSGSYDPDGTIVHYLWEFGDGEYAEGPDESITYHIYDSTAGSPYTLTLTVTDNQGASNSATALVYVNEPPEVYIHVWWGIIPVGWSGPDPNGHKDINGKVNRAYTFNPYGIGGYTNDPDGTIVAYQWKIDNENPPWQNLPPGNTIPSYVKTWDTSGVYDVTLSVKDDDNCIRYAVITMHINP